MPTSINWNTKGKVTPIKDQGECGCCWAFSSTALFESVYAIKTEKLKNFAV
jgi:C1A family cysteine protease